MQEQWLALFFWPEEPDVRLTFEGDRDGEELLDGRIMAGSAQVGRVVDGVLVFAGLGRGWSAEAMEEARRERWVQNNWNKGADLSDENPVDRRVYDELTAVEGPILEFAAGPVGGKGGALQ